MYCMYNVYMVYINRAVISIISDTSVDIWVWWHYVKLWNMGIGLRHSLTNRQWWPKAYTCVQIIQKFAIE